MTDRYIVNEKNKKGRSWLLLGLVEGRVYCKRERITRGRDIWQKPEWIRPD